MWLANLLKGLFIGGGFSAEQKPVNIKKVLEFQKRYPRLPLAFAVSPAFSLFLIGLALLLGYAFALRLGIAHQ